MKNSSIIKIVAAVAVLATAAIALLWLTGNLPWGAERVTVPPPVGGGANPKSGFGSSLYGGAGATNPVSDLPKTNPFSTSVNPYAGAYKNPFGQ